LRKREEGRRQRRLELLMRHVVPGGERISAAPACGIMAYVGPEEAHPFLMEGLRILQNRGYDSAGMASIGAGGMVTTKYASSASTNDAVAKLGREVGRHAGHRVGIAHTRWATHGAKTDRNAHPHCDERRQVAVVHNGIIDNASELRAELEAAGVHFASETDTEVVAQLMGRAMSGGKTLQEAILAAIEKMQGTWGLVALSLRESGTLVAAARGSPLVVGIGNGCTFISSEVTAFSRYAREYIVLRDDEVAVVTAEGHSLEQARAELSPESVAALTPAPFPHWTIKEIVEQPEAISRCLSYGSRFAGMDNVRLGGLDLQQASLSNVRNLVITGCGSSYFAAQFGARVVRNIGGLDTVAVVDASELTGADFPRHNAALLVLSQSGETKDCHRALTLADDLGVFSFSIVNVVRSLIARHTGCGVYMHAGRENGVASTKSFSCQIVALSLVALWFAQANGVPEGRRRRLIEDLQRLPTVVGMVLSQVRQQCAQIAKRVALAQSAFILGRGYAEPIAYESALKVKEITYIHAEGYAGGALKHGPFALIEEGTLIFLIILEDEHLRFMRTVASEVRARGAYVVAITNSRTVAADRELVDEAIIVRHDGLLTAYLAVLPMQLIAYETALLRGHDPDFPRHLAKTVSVD